MKNRKRQYWRILRTLALIVSLLTFTPLVIPNGEYRPMVFGMPYTLWMGYLWAFILVGLTYLGTKNHPGMDEEEEVNS
jgi:hypothetical protein